jgi:hypothetical protein
MRFFGKRYDGLEKGVNGQRRLREVRETMMNWEKIWGKDARGRKEVWVRERRRGDYCRKWQSGGEGRDVWVAEKCDDWVIYEELAN